MAVPEEDGMAYEHDEGRPPEQAAGGERRDRKPGVGSRILRWRIPLWVTLLLLVVLVVGGLVVWFSDEEPDLGPAIDGARQVEVEVLVCNELVDARGFNPRTAELEFEEGLIDLGAEEADVTVERRDCGEQEAAGG